jgi:hypothetical protein
MIPPHTTSSLCFFLQRNHVPAGTGRRRGINISGVDFWHAVEFSRNGRFLRTHPLGLSSGLPFGVSDSIRSFRRPIPRQRGLPSRLLGRSDVSNLSGSAR